MKIDMSQLVVDFENRPVQVPDGKGPKSTKDLTLRNACIMALMSQTEDEQRNPDHEEQLRFGNLANRIASSSPENAIGADGSADLTAAEIATIQKRLGIALPTMVVWRVNSLLEPQEEPEAAKKGEAK